MVYIRISDSFCYIILLVHISNILVEVNSATEEKIRNNV